MTVQKKGRGNIANLKPCKPGETHNPHGRPRKEHCFGDIAREMLGAKTVTITLTTPDGKKRDIGISATPSIRHGLIAAMIREGFKGNVQAAKELIDRTDGRVADLMNLTISKPEPIAITIMSNEEHAQNAVHALPETRPSPDQLKA